MSKNAKPGIATHSAKARLGKGQGAKEIGHNRACERPKFGHNPTRERNEVWAQFCGRSMKTWAKTCKHFTVYTHFYIGCLKTQQQLHVINGKQKCNLIYYFFFHSIRALCKSGRA